MTVENADASPPVTVGLSLGGRYLVVLAVVGAWMLAGFLFHLSGNAYLVAGVPLLLFFQVLVARRPIAELWFKRRADAPLPGWAWAVGAAFMVLPATSLVREWGRTGWDVHLWYVCSIAGAVPLAHSLARFSRSALRALLVCLATAGVLGVLFTTVPALLMHHHAAASGVARTGDPFGGDFRPRLLEMARSFALYLPVVFVLEEVFFRGGLDSYLHRSDDPDPWISAGFVSALWGSWHFPLLLPGMLHAAVPPAAIAVAAVAVILIHYFIGTPLSMAWRRSGLLLVPALVHAFIDAVRNGMQMHT
jgi:hypothetical protein